MQNHLLVYGSDLESSLRILTPKIAISSVICVGNRTFSTNIFPIIDIIVQETEVHFYQLLNDIYPTINEISDNNNKKIIPVITRNTPLEIALAFYHLIFILQTSGFQVVKSKAYPITNLTIERLSDHSSQILVEVDKAKIIESIKDLAKLLLENHEDPKIIAKLVYIIKKLEMQDYVKTKKKGQSLSVSITDKGHYLATFFQSKKY
jgi:hypothetical protein